MRIYFRTPFIGQTCASVGDTEMFRDKSVRGFNMEASPSLSNPNDMNLIFDASDSTAAFLPGAGLQFDSSAPGYNTNGDLSVMLLRGAQTFDGFRIDTGLYLYSAENRELIDSVTGAHTPEPGSALLVTSI